MKYLVDYPAPLLGPCRCQGCGEPVWWAERNTRRMGMTVLRTAWREEDGALHVCPALPGRVELRQRRRDGRWVA